MMEHSHALLGSKGKLIHGVKKEIAKTSETHNKLQEMKEIGKREAELHYKQEYASLSSEHKTEMTNLKDQYEYILSQKNEELARFHQQAKDYIS